MILAVPVGVFYPVPSRSRSCLVTTRWTAVAGNNVSALRRLYRQTTRWLEVTSWTTIESQCGIVAMLKIADPRMSGGDNDTMLTRQRSLFTRLDPKRGCVSTNALAAGVRQTRNARALPRTRAMPCKLVCNQGRAHISARTHASAAQEPPCTAALLNGAGCVRPSTPKARTRSLSAIPCIALGCALRNGEPQRLPDQQARHPRPCVEDD